MPGKPEMPFLAMHPGMRLASHELGDLLEVGVENPCPVEYDLDGGTLDGNLLHIPLAVGTLKPSFPKEARTPRFDTTSHPTDRLT